MFVSYLLLVYIQLNKKMFGVLFVISLYTAK